MSTLAPNLFDKRFQDLMQIGRALLPWRAPDWTDHNAHDPGITLMELLAWVAEAQLYALGHVRRDERAAYAALLGLAPGGTQGARGLIWPDGADPTSPLTTYSMPLALSQNTVINMLGIDSPTFRPVDTLLWVPGSITSLVTRHADGQTDDHTSANGRRVAFLPFGESAGRRDVLSLSFQCRDDAGLFGKDRKSAKGARWAIGVRAAPPVGGAAATGEPGPNFRSPLKATLVNNGRRETVTIASDTTQGLLTTGAILLDLDDVATSPRDFAIELSAPGGFARPPRLLRIEPNVIPIEQGRTISSEAHAASGAPDLSFTLDVPGLRFAEGRDSVTIEVAEASGLVPWKNCTSLSECGPNDNGFEIDATTGRVTFGNGLNGRIPPAGSQVLVTYAVSDGDQGNVARNRKWKVTGIEGVAGINLDPITGGASPPGWDDQRHEARQRFRADRALVTAEDIVAAALALPLLEVARAWVAAPNTNAPQMGMLTLVALRSRPNGLEPQQVPETARWLEAIRRSLAAQMPLGTRLAVVAPRYKDFSTQLTLEAHPRLDPKPVEDAVMKELARRFSLDGRADGATPRQPGVPLSKRDLAAWLRTIAGVKRVVDLQFLDANGQDLPEICVSPNGLPRWDSGASKVHVNRSGPGSTP
jgi:hypothetical protein